MWPSTGSNWLYERMTTGSSSTHQQRQALCVCIYVIGQAREAKCGRVATSTRANETGQDRTSHFLPPPLVKLPIFTPVAVELLCLSLWATSWWHSGQQTQQANRRKLGARQQRGSVSEHIKYKAAEELLIKPQTLCLGLFSLVLVDLQTKTLPCSRDHVDMFTSICCGLLESNTDGDGSNVVVLLALDGVSDLPSTLLWAWLATGCDLAQQVKQLSHSPQVLFTTGGSQGQRTWFFFKFKLTVPRAKLLRTHCCITMIAEVSGQVSQQRQRTFYYTIS